MKKIVKSTFAVAIVAALAAIGYVSYTQYQDNQFAFANPLMEENIEALSDNYADGGGEKYEYCVEYHSTSMFAFGDNFKCKDGTVMSIPVPKTPMSPVYSCDGSKGKTTILAKMGYCSLPN